LLGGKVPAIFVRTSHYGQVAAEAPVEVLASLGMRMVTISGGVAVWSPKSWRRWLRRWRGRGRVFRRCRNIHRGSGNI